MMTKLLGCAAIVGAILILGVLCVSSINAATVIGGTTIGAVLLDIAGDRRTPGATAGRPRRRTM